MNRGNYILKKKVMHSENKYLNMINRIIKDGTKQEGRNSSVPFILIPDVFHY